MLTLSIRQPWAWLILHGGKDVENRTWPTRVRGRIQIHASAGMTRREYDEARLFARRIHPALDVPAPSELLRGGIIGTVELWDCVTASPSPWFMPHPFQESVGFLLRDPQPGPFIRCSGKLGFFNAP